MSDPGGATVPVARARDVAEATIWVDTLRQAGIQAASYESRPSAGALGGATMAVGWEAMILVHKRDIVSARNLIAEMGGARALTPVPDDTAPSTGLTVWITIGGVVLVALALVAAVMR
jgi:hypothetical protein